MNLEKILVSILYIHQTMDVIGIKGYVIRPKLISPDTIGWSLFTVLFILYQMNVPYVNFIFIALFGLVLYGLYHFHWKLFWFGATDKKIKGYNECFTGTHRIWPESPKRLVPDTFHILHSVLYVVTFVGLVVNVF